MSEIDLNATLQQMLLQRQPEVWQRIQEYYAETGQQSELAGIAGLDPAGTVDYYDQQLIITDFTLSGQDPILTPDYVIESDIQNTTTATVTETVNLSKSTTNTFTFQMNQQLKVGAKAQISAGFEFLAEAKVEVSLEVTFGFQETWTTTTTSTWQFTLAVPVPPQSFVKVVGIVQTGALNYDFAANIHCGGKALIWFKKTDGTYTEWPIDLEVLLEPDESNVPVTGTLKGAVGIRSSVEARPAQALTQGVRAPADALKSPAPGTPAKS